MLTPGARLGPYEVVGSLGKGGMGEVHRAKDTRLGREVALKVLPDDVAADPARMARFEREARLLAALNHPHIAAIYGLEEEGESRTLVMEVAEGSTLLERIKQGPIAVDDALPIARQMAEALEYAHEKGIVHRDLKPANVMVTPDGEVKLLDFGLAKAYAGDAEEEERDYSESPTMSHQATREGLILGTASYMSPEQARGKTVDRRADIWSFGVVLLEMLSGRPTFTGESVTDVLAAVVRNDPDLERLPAETPSTVRGLLKRCLDKDPKHRLRDIGEARILLEAPGTESDGPVEIRRPPFSRARAALAVALLALSALLGFLGALLFLEEPRGEIDARHITFRRGAVINARFAPDGQTVIYSGTFDGRPLEVYSVRIDTRESRPLGLQGANVLAVSSSGELALSLGHRYTRGFQSTGTLARVPLGGAAPREVLEQVEGADWASDGQSLAVVRNQRNTQTLEYPLGTVLYETGGWISHPRVSPDGRRVAFLDHPERGDAIGDVTVVDREGQLHVLARNGHSGMAWSPSGDEVIHYGSGRSLRATRLTGESRVLYQSLGDLALHDVAPDGRLLLASRTYHRELVGQGPGGTAPLNLSWGDWSFPTFLSADGLNVLIEEQRLVTDQGNYALFLRPTDGSPAVHLGDGRAFGLSADGRWVLSARYGDGGEVEVWLLPTGVGEARRLFPLDEMPSAGAFLPDGERVVLTVRSADAGTRLHVCPISGGGPVAFSPAGVLAPLRRLLLPDGYALANAPDGPLTLYPIDGGEPHEVPGVAPDDTTVGWHAGSRTVFVRGRSGIPALLDRVNIDTGERTPWKELVPPDPAGISVVDPIIVSADGRSLVYSYRRVLERLVVVDGLQ